MRQSMPRRPRIRRTIVLACVCLPLALAVPLWASAIALAASRSPGTVIGGITIPQTPTDRPARTQTEPQLKTPASAVPQGGSTQTTSKPAVSTPGSATSPPAGTTTSKAGIVTAPAGSTTAPTLATTTPAAATPAVTTPAGTPAPTTGTPATPAIGAPSVTHRTSAGSTRLSPWAIAAAALAVLLILASLAWGAARWYAYEPRWTLSLRHASEEAGLRLGATWAEFADWAKLGR
jgi:hypothetical protein